MPRLLPYPWSLLLRRDEKGAAFDLSAIEDGDIVRTDSFAILTKAQGEDLPRLKGHRHHFPIHSTEVPLGLNAENGKSTGLISIPLFHRDGPTNLTLSVGSLEFTLNTEGALRRASAGEALISANRTEVLLRDTIDKLCAYFVDAGTLAVHEGPHASHGMTGQSIFRIDWSLVWPRWRQVSNGDHPPMARIVAIAQEHAALVRDVSERPRRILLRHRDLIPLRRVQELDTTCIRDLIRRPGRNVLEKAGPKQSILAITRKESVDTAENRVLKDFLHLCQYRSRAYERENVRSAQNARVVSVRLLRHSCERLLVHAPIREAGRLIGSAKPNYVLQKDRRYHQVWQQYEKLKKEEESIDAIWAWGRRLWSDFVRGIILAFLHSDPTEATTGWRSEHRHWCYLRAEHQAGSFLPALSVSSRWKHQRTSSLMYAVHPAHSHRCPGLENILPKTGADLILVSYHSNTPTKPKAVLAIYGQLSLKQSNEMDDEMHLSLELAMSRLAHSLPDVSVHALLLRGGLDPLSPEATPRGAHYDSLFAPTDGGYWFNEFPTHISVILEEMA